MNKVVLHGRLARDVELRTTNSGKSVAQVSIAVNRRGKDGGADFIPLVIWGQLAETFARYLSKGREVLVEGHMQVRSYDDRNGNKQYVTEVIVETFDFCGSSGNNNNNGNNNNSTPPPPDNSNIDAAFGQPQQNVFGGRPANDEDIPF